MPVKTIWRVLLGLALTVPAASLQAMPGKETPHNQSQVQDTISRKVDTSSLTDEIETASVNLQEVKIDPKNDFKKSLFKETSVSAEVAYLNPQMTKFLKTYGQANGDMLDDMKDWALPKFNTIEDIFEQNGLPAELKYLAVIESKMKATARSKAGAVGYWQFMSTTGRDFGLRINSKVDERKNLTKSTRAAAKYINYLYKIYGDWLLVIAAYNSGPGGVNAAIRKSGSRDFWKLQRFLPAESRGHVKRYIATHHYMEGHGGPTTLTKFETKKYLVIPIEEIVDVEPPAKTTQDTPQKNEAEIVVSHAISGRYNSSLIIQKLEMEKKEFHKLNPDFDRLIADNAKYQLKLPSEKMNSFLGMRQEILDASMQALLNQASGTTETVDMK